MSTWCFLCALQDEKPEPKAKAKAKAKVPGASTSVLLKVRREEGSLHHTGAPLLQKVCSLNQIMAAVLKR